MIGRAESKTRRPRGIGHDQVRRNPHERPVTRAGPPSLNEDEQLLAELGYKQELERSWGGFTNFAISFSIISILAGCFTNFFAAWNNGGPVMVSIGLAGRRRLHPDHRAVHGRDRLGDARPQAASTTGRRKLGGPGWGWFTGWFNLVGLVGVVASVDYACASFLSYTIGLFDTSYDAFNLKYIFLIFLCILAVHVFINLFPAHILSIWNNTSAYWHMVGAAIIVLILIFGPTSHQSASFVFTHWINNSGFSGGTSGLKFFLYVVPLGVILTQYTITGFDASAHLSEETTGAAKAAAQGMWRSVFYSAIGGWILLLCFLFAVKNADVISTSNPYGAGSSIGIFADGAGPGRVQGRDDHLDHRPVLLRRLRPDQRLADDVRVQPRPRGARAPDLVEGGPEPGAAERDAGHGGDLRDRRPCRRCTATRPGCRSRSTRWHRSRWSASTSPTPSRSS